MKIGVCVLILVIVGAGAVALDGDETTLEMRFRHIGKNAAWELVETIEVAFRTYHPQGMTAVGDRFFLSSVEVVDRRADQGIGHLCEMDRAGNLLRKMTLGEDKMYHPGGIDYDGAVIWVSVAEYRPDSASIVYVVDPETMQYREVFRFSDHLGAITHFPDKNLLIAASWGSRRFYVWNTVLQEDEWRVPNPATPIMKPNGNHYIDYQDMQRIPGSDYLLCSGLQSYQPPDSRLPALRLGGIELVHADELRAHHQIPVPLRGPAAPAWTQNPFYVTSTDNGLRFFFLPEDDASNLYVFEVGTVANEATR